MIENLIDYGQPEAGAVINEAIQTDASARLNYNLQDVSAIEIGDAGELIITFRDSGQLVLADFEGFTEDGNSLYFQDGTLIDPNLIASPDTLIVNKPVDEDLTVVNMESGKKYVCDFDPANAALVEVKDGQMVLTFADGSQVVLNNYSDVMAGDLPSELTVADGTVVAEEEILTQVTEVEAVEEILEVAEAVEESVDLNAQRVANIEPAAGEDSVAEALANIEPAAGGDGAAGNSGYGFNSSPVQIDLIAPDAIGPLGPTQLRYVAPQFQQEQLLSADPRPDITPTSAVLDETNLQSDIPGGPIPLVATGTVFVDYGGDGPGTITGTGNVSFQNNFLPVTGLTSAGVPVVIAFDSSTNTYTGTAGGTTVFTMVLDVNTGDFTYTQVEPFDHADNTNNNEPITINFQYAVEDSDGDIETTAIRISVRDDGPEVRSVTDTVVDETNFTAGPLTVNGQFNADVGEDVNGTFPGNDSFNATGSVATGALRSCGDLIDVTFDLATNTYTGTANGTVVFTVVIDATDGSYTYTQFAPIDHADTANPNDVIALEFGIDVVDYDGDRASGIVRVNVYDDGPALVGAYNTVDETDLGTPAVIVNGSVTPNFGGDGAAATNAVDATGTFSSDGSQLGGTLTSNGVTVDVAFDPVTNIYTGTAGAQNIFTMVINSDGTYTFELLGTLDHADPNDPNDIINLNFGAVATDKDGDTATANIIISVKDDVPTINPSSGDVDETNLDGGPLVYIDTVVTNVGPNLSTITPNNNTSSSTPLQTCGDAVTITQVGNTYTGATAGGVVVFTLVVDETTGQYTYTQFEPLDHPDSADHDDVLSIEFGVTVTTLDGSTDNAVITINVADDGPDAVNDINGAEESQFITGNVVANDDLSEDDANTVTNVNFKGVDYPVVAGVATTIIGDHGTLNINNDGTYNYTANSNDPNGVDTFTYTLKDCDDDTDTATLSITVTPDGEPVQVSKLLAVDETNLTPGPMIFNGDLEVDFGIDGAGTVTPTDATSFVAGGSLAGGALTSGGVPVVVTLSGNTYTGTAGTTTVFTVTINNDGTYNFQLLDHIDHADSTDPNDVITMEFGVRVTDADGDTSTGTFTVNVHDDAPVAYDDITSAEENQLITGDVVANDEQSEDDPSLVTNVRFAGVDYPITAGGSTTIATPHGVLVMQNDGTYTFQAANNDPNGLDVFEYTLTDYDGDQDTATLSITVTPDGTPVAVSQQLAVDETNLTPGPMIFNGSLNVDFGLDGPGTVTAQGANTFVAGGSLAGGTLTSGGVPVVVTLSGDTYTGTAGTTTVFTVKINNDGTYNFQLFDHIDHADSTDPNDIITLEFGVTATDPDGDSANGTFTVLVHDDAPVAYDDGAQAVIELQTATGNVITGVGGPNATADESSEDRPTDLVEVIFNGAITVVPTVGTVNVTGQFGVLTIASNGSYSYTANANTPVGVDTFTYVIEDYDGDRDTAEFSFNVSPENDTPIVTQPDILTVDDTNLDTGNNVVTGTVVVDYQDDGPGEVNLVDGGITSSVALTSCDKDITTTLSGNTYTGALADGTVVFTMEVLENGSYTFTQLEAIDHPNTLNPNDNVRINFTVRATDADGDFVDTTIRVNVLDDGPQIEEIAQEVYEDVITDTTPLVATGSVDVDFGEDGAGEVTANGLFEAKFQMDGSAVTLTTGGKTIAVTNTTNGYTGTDSDGNIIFTLSIDPTNGDYTYNQFEAIDHPDASNPDDVIWLKFYVDVHDCDGDLDTGIIIIDVHDDGPVANNDTNTISSSETVKSGNVLTNDDAGVDDSSVVVTTPGTFTGTYGTLVLRADGTYDYTRNGNTGGVDTFDYTMRDADGDTDTATLTITVADDESPININGVGETDDTVVGNNGSDTETGTINVNYQGDGPGTTTGNDTFSSGGFREGNTLSHNGTLVNVTFNAATNTYTGVAGSVTVFTMEINANGTYEFVQYENLDHSDTTDDNEAITLEFGVTATDVDGDTGTGTVTITVRDDGPNAQNDNFTTTSGNVLTNDDVGADDPGTVTEFNIGGTWYNAGETVDTSLGLVKLESDGSYTLVDLKETTSSSTFTRKTDTDSSIREEVTDVRTDVTSTDTVTKGSVYSEVTNTSSRDYSAVTDVSTNDRSVSTGFSSRDYSEVTDVSTRDYSEVTIFSTNERIVESAPVVETWTERVVGNGVITTTTYQRTTVNCDTYRDTMTRTTDYRDTTTTTTNYKDITTTTTNYRDTTTTTTDYRDTTTTRTSYQDVTTTTTDTLNTYTDVTRYRDTTDTFTDYRRTTTTTGGELDIIYRMVDTDGDTSEATLNVDIPIRTSNDTDVIRTYDRSSTDNLGTTTTVTHTNQGSSSDTVTVNLGSSNNTTTQTLGSSDNTTTQTLGSSDNTVTHTLGSSDNTTTRVTDWDDVLTSVKIDTQVKTDVVVTDVHERDIPDGPGDGGGGDGPGGCNGDPLVIDLDGDGIELIAKEDGVMFDINDDGIEDQTAWVGADDGLLAIDKNGDGEINGVSELFGDTDGNTDGFDNLDNYDLNNDGVIDANDEIYGDLLVWQDANSDGQSQSDEMLTLEQIGIVSISLNTQTPEDLYIEGNWISHVSSYLTSDGETREIVDAWFEHDNGASSFVIEGTEESDSFIFQAIQESAVIVQNFDTAEDVIDISGLIEGNDNVTEAINDFVYVTEEDGATVISVDVDGSAGPEEAREVAKVDGVTGQTLDDLIDNGNIIV